jgi:hypothetical protein
MGRGVTALAPGFSALFVWVAWICAQLPTTQTRWRGPLYRGLLTPSHPLRSRRVALRPDGLLRRACPKKIVFMVLPVSTIRVV